MPRVGSAAVAVLLARRQAGMERTSTDVTRFAKSSESVGLPGSPAVGRALITLS